MVRFYFDNIFEKKVYINTLLVGKRKILFKKTTLIKQ